MKNLSRTGLLVRSSFTTAIVAAATVVALSLSGGASASSSASSSALAAAQTCKGTPLVIGAIGNISNSIGQQVPEFAAGARAAAAALTRTCQLGRPVTIFLCDDKFNPNDAAACGREMVSRKVLMVVTYSGYGDSYIPTVAAAGIPVLPVNATSAQESTNPLVYAFGYPIASLIGQINIAASTGRRKVALTLLDIPAVQFFVGLVGKFAKGLNVEIVKTIPVPVTATDMTGIAGQVISSGANALVTIIGPNQQLPLFRAIRQQGAGVSKIRFIGSFLTVSQRSVGILGTAAPGILLSGWAWSPTDTSKPFVRQHLKELKAAKQKAGPLDVDQISQTVWGSIHTTADALKAAKLAPTSANVPKALEVKGLGKTTTKYGLSPINFTTKAFGNDPLLGPFRIFSSYQCVFEVDKKGIPRPLSQKWLPVKRVQKLKLLSG